jgi:hypothetical protein
MENQDMNAHLPKIHFDWTINITNLVTILFFLATVVAGWYDLKSEVVVDKASADIKFQNIDRAFVQQEQINAETNARIATSSNDMKQALRDSALDIKSDIRELQSEVIKSENHR